MTVQGFNSFFSGINAFNHQQINTNTTTNGAIIDTEGSQGVVFYIQSGTITDGTYTPLVRHGDDSGLSDVADVTTEYLDGTVAAATFAAVNDNTVKQIGYSGKKRYVRLSIVSASTSSGGYIGAIAVKKLTRSATV